MAALEGGDHVALDGDLAARDVDEMAPAGMAAKAAALAMPRVSGEAGQHRISQSASGSTSRSWP